MSKAERDELHALASNIRDDRLRALVFKLLETTETNEHEESKKRTSR